MPDPDALERKDRLTELLMRVDQARDAARVEAGLPDATDDDDTEEQTLLRVGILECDAALEREGVFE